MSQVLTDRIIQVTHANWSLLGGRRGQVEKDVTVVDVSAAGDWSQVKVWYDPKGDLGTTIYPTYGFIYKALDAHDPRRRLGGRRLARRSVRLSTLRLGARRAAVVRTPPRL